MDPWPADARQKRGWRDDPRASDELPVVNGGSWRLRDHSRRMVSSDGRTWLIAEPYKLLEEELADLAELRRRGWQIQIEGDGTHDPKTVRVIYWRDPEYDARRGLIPPVRAGDPVQAERL
jgi:hypothetical protein